jgi:hypothetical protein
MNDGEWIIVDEGDNTVCTMAEHPDGLMSVKYARMLLYAPVLLDLLNLVDDPYGTAQTLKEYLRKPWYNPMPAVREQGGNDQLPSDKRAEGGGPLYYC